MDAEKGAGDGIVVVEEDGERDGQREMWEPPKPGANLNPSK